MCSLLFIKTFSLDYFLNYICDPFSNINCKSVTSQLVAESQPLFNGAKQKYGDSFA